MLWNKPQKKPGDFIAEKEQSEQINSLSNIKETYETEEDNILEVITKLAPIIRETIPMECAIGIIDKEKYLCYIPSQEINMDCKSGDPVRKGSGLYNSLVTGKATETVVPKEIFGSTFKSRSIPLRDKRDNVVGAAAIAVSLKNQEALIDVAQTVASSTQENSATVEELASSAQQLAGSQEIIERLGEEVLEQVKKTDAILSFINEVADTSNLLGLNAAIEAARAGEHGRGFSVVAGEIRKLSIKSTQAVKEIRNILANINDNVLLMAEKVVESSALSEEQAAATEEISATMQDLAVSSGKIRNMASQF